MVVPAVMVMVVVVVMMLVMVMVMVLVVIAVDVVVLFMLHVVRKVINRILFICLPGIVNNSVDMSVSH